MTSLRDVKIGSSFKVLRVNGEGAVRRRMMDMGITSGAKGIVRKVAPLGDPIEIHIRGYELSIRKKDAECVEVEIEE